jgi:hypothetical protein
MKLTGIHLLVTYQCLKECDHCFVWGSPRQTGTMTVGFMRDLLRQARELGSVEQIYFEGGEPFLYYAALLQGARMAAEAGFEVGLVTNAYWATSKEDALLYLRPFQGVIGRLTVSSDLFHADEPISRCSLAAVDAAGELGIRAETISIAQPGSSAAAIAQGQLPPGTSAVMYRGRAAEALASSVPAAASSELAHCPYEDLREPGRVHLDAEGHLHVCQGISIGNLGQASLARICESYDPDAHPVVGPLLQGGPAELARRHGLPHGPRYADACHLCYETRAALRSRYPGALAPDQAYGVSCDR